MTHKKTVRKTVTSKTVTSELPLFILYICKDSFFQWGLQENNILNVSVLSLLQLKVVTLIATPHIKSMANQMIQFNTMENVRKNLAMEVITHVHPGWLIISLICQSTNADFKCLRSLHSFSTCPSRHLLSNHLGKSLSSGPGLTVKKTDLSSNRENQLWTIH